MINNNFGNLVGSISQLNDRARVQTASAYSAPPNFSLDYGDVTVNFSDTTGLSPSFQGFEETLGNRYSMNNQETLQLLQMFVLVIGELMDAVVSNSSADQSKNSDQVTETPASKGNQPMEVKGNNVGQPTGGASNNGGQPAGGAGNNAVQSSAATNTSATSIEAIAEVGQSEGNAPVHTKGSCPFTAMKEAEGA